MIFNLNINTYGYGNYICIKWWAIGANTGPIWMVEWLHWLNGYESEQNLGEVKDRDAWYAAHHGVRVGHALAAE